MQTYFRVAILSTDSVRLQQANYYKQLKGKAMALRDKNTLKCNQLVNKRVCDYQDNQIAKGADSEMIEGFFRKQVPLVSKLADLLVCNWQ